MIRRPPEDEAGGHVVDERTLAELQRLFGGNEVRLLRGVLGTGPRRLRDLRAALVQHDPDALAWSAEALRGGAELVGAFPFAELCTRLAEAARRGAWSDVEALLSPLEEEHVRVRRRLEGELGAPGDAQAGPDDDES